MGDAKRRGTFEQRKAMAVEKQAEERAFRARIMAQSGKSVKVRTSTLMAVALALAASGK